jgi:hypothetical protein
MDRDGQQRSGVDCCNKEVVEEQNQENTQSAVGVASALPSEDWRASSLTFARAAVIEHGRDWRR